GCVILPWRWAMRRPVWIFRRRCNNAGRWPRHWCRNTSTGPCNNSSATRSITAKLCLTATTGRSAMPPAAHPQQEQLRLEALQAVDILYLPLEEPFARITRILCRLFNVPIAYLSLMEADTQWFKSIQGADLLSTPRSDSLCQHTLLEDEMLICPDTLQDPRF